MQDLHRRRRRRRRRRMALIGDYVEQKVKGRLSLCCN
jgi:hypothetical protein